MARPAAVLDANVLYPARLRDLFLRLAVAGHFRALWTERILDECFNNLLADRPDIPAEHLHRTRRLMTRATPDAVVQDYDYLIKGLDLPDPDDRHVLAAAVTAGADLVLVVGPAGAGKTRAVAPAVEELRADGRAVIGVAPSAAAAEVLAADAGPASDTLDKLLIEHRLDRPPDHRYDLPPGSTVAVDEAAMVSTPRWPSWPIWPTNGDGVSRWSATRCSSPPSGARGCSAISSTARRHRARPAPPLRQWWEAKARGESIAMMAPTNEIVVELNRLAQGLRVREGEIDPGGPSVEAGNYRLHVGDHVATRHNDSQLHTDRGLMVKNGDRREIDAVHLGGALTVSGKTGTVRLPAHYVAEHVELAYAQTSHASQGRTVDRSFLLLDGPADTRGVYVPMTPGRHANEAFVVLEGEQTALDVLAQALARDWNRRARRGPPGGAAAEHAAEPEPEPRPADGTGRAARPAGAPARHHRGPFYGRVPGEQVRRPGRPGHQASRRAGRETRRRHSREGRGHAGRRRSRPPLQRRFHRSELGQAYASLRQARLDIERQSTELADLDRRLSDGGRRSARPSRRCGTGRLWIGRHTRSTVSLSATSLPAGRPSPPTRRSRSPTGSALVRTGAPQTSGRTPRRTSTSTASAFGITNDRNVLGSSIRAREQSALVDSQRGVTNACDRLARSLGRGPVLERGHELGIDLSVAGH